MEQLSTIHVAEQWRRGEMKKKKKKKERRMKGVGQLTKRRP
jgi:hypothetical protein